MLKDIFGLLECQVLNETDIGTFIKTKGIKCNLKSDVQLNLFVFSKKQILKVAPWSFVIACAEDKSSSNLLMLKGKSY